MCILFLQVHVSWVGTRMCRFCNRPLLFWKSGFNIRCLFHFHPQFKDWLQKLVEFVLKFIDWRVKRKIWFWYGFANVVRLWFCIWVVVEISSRTYVPKFFFEYPLLERGKPFVIRYKDHQPFSWGHHLVCALGTLVLHDMHRTLGTQIWCKAPRSSAVAR